VRSHWLQSPEELIQRPFDGLSIQNYLSPTAWFAFRNMPLSLRCPRKKEQKHSLGTSTMASEIIRLGQVNFPIGEGVFYFRSRIVSSSVFKIVANGVQALVRAIPDCRR
jgi:hypothetical protein